LRGLAGQSGITPSDVKQVNLIGSEFRGMSALVAVSAALIVCSLNSVVLL